MFNDDVEDLDAVIDQNLKLLLSSRRFVPAREDRLMRTFRTFGEPVASRGGQYFLSTGSQNCHVLHDALPAHLKASRQLSTPNRDSVSAHPVEHAAATIIPRIEL
jgi:hypothetical protein